MQVGTRTLYPRYGKVFVRKNGKNVESKQIGAFIADNRKDGQKCLGVYEVRTPVLRGQNPIKDLEFFVNNLWVEIKSKRNTQQWERTIKHPAHLELRIPDNVSDAIFFDEKMRIFAVRLAIIEAKSISKKRKLDKVEILTSDIVPAKMKKSESGEYEKQLRAQFEKVPRTQVIPTLHLKKDGVEEQEQTDSDVNSDVDTAKDNKIEASFSKPTKKVEVEGGTKMITTENQSNLKQGKTNQQKKRKQNKNKKKREKQRIQSKKNQLKKEEEKAKEIENKYSKEFALVDNLVAKMERTSEVKQKQVKKKLDAIEAIINHKYQKKRGQQKNTAKLKKLSVEGVRREMRQKKLEARERYKKKKETDLKFV